MGERAIRFAPNGGDFVDVCPLCQELALEHGWVKEGSPTTPVGRRRRGEAAPRSARSSKRGAPAHARRSRQSRSCAGCRSPSWRWSRRPTCSTRASSGARSAGSRRASASRARSIVPLSGVKPRARRHGRLGHLLVPVPRQPRLGSAGPPRRARPRSAGARVTFTAWNARLEDDGRIVPDIARALAQPATPLPTIRA